MRAKRRVGLRLLVLLWIWAICVFACLDLFLNVPELDGVRPRTPLYRGMRVAAHKLVGEPLAGDDSAAVLLRRPRTARRDQTGDWMPPALREALSAAGYSSVESASALLALRGDVPEPLIAEYAVALARRATGTPPGPRAKLARAALLSLCAGEPDWSAAAEVLHTLSRCLRGFQDDARFALPVARLRQALLDDLENERALASALVIGTPAIAARALDLLDHLPLDEDPPRWLHAARMILRHGNEHQRAALSEWVIRSRERAQDRRAQAYLRLLARG